MLSFNIDRSVFQLNVHFCKVLSDNSQTKENKASDKQKQNYGRGITGNIYAEAKLLYDDGDHIKKREDR